MSRIVPLDELDDFEVADEDPDVRGWRVYGTEGEIGKVDQLLVDTAAMKVRYLDVDLNDDLLTTDEDRHVLIPIGYARLDEGDGQIFVDNITRDRLVGLPAYTHGTVTRDYETQIRQAFDTEYTTEADRDFYAHDLYDQDRFYGREVEGEAELTLSEEELAVGKREKRAGEVEIDKEVETRHVAKKVPVEHEEVEIERRPARPGARAEIRDDEIHVPLSEEELVVEKRAVPKEELVVRKKEVVDEETVEADLRRERAEIHEEGDVRRER